MSLILAIEPDRRRAAQLTGMARAHLRAELLVAPTASQAVDGLDGRVPDILLTAPLLPSQEEAAIADYLRQLGSAAAHVQTLTIPLLANGSGEDDRPVLSAFLRDRVRRTETEGCDPSVFAEQITEYLREARERREVPPPISSVVQSEVTPPPVLPAKAQKGVMARLLLAAAAEEKPDEFLEFVVETPERPDQASVNAAPSRREAAEPEPNAPYRREPPTAAESQEDDAPGMQSEWMSGAAAQSPSPALMPEDSPLSLAVIDAPVAPVAHREQVISTPAPTRPEMPAVNVAVAVSVNAGGAVNMVTPRRSTRPRKAQPVKDEWVFFDPNQCGFPALIAKLDEIAGLDETDN
jgi:hypothetical protein